MEIVGRLDHRFLLALAAGGRNNLGLLPFAREAFLNGNGQRGVRAEFQPDIHAVLRHRVDRFDETHGLTDPAPPVGRDTVLPATTLSGHRAEKRNRPVAWLQVGQPLLHGVGCRLHHGVVEGMADPDEAGEHAGRFQLGRHFLE